MLIVGVLRVGSATWPKKPMMEPSNASLNNKKWGKLDGKPYRGQIVLHVYDNVGSYVFVVQLYLSCLVLMTMVVNNPSK